MTFFVAARKMSACCFSKMSIGRSRTLCEPHPPTLTPSSFMALQNLERGEGRKDGQWATLNRVWRKERTHLALRMWGGRKRRRSPPCRSRGIALVSQRVRSQSR